MRKSHALMLSTLILLAAVAIWGGPAPSQAQDSQSIRYGQTVVSDLPDAAGDRWKFSGRAGDLVNINVQSPMFDTYLELIGPDGALVAENDDNGPGLNSLLVAPLPADGTYQILVYAYENRVAYGTYILTLDDATDSATLLYDETTGGTIRSRQNVIFRFAGAGGDLVSIALDSDDRYAMDLYISLVDPAGVVIAEDNDSGRHLNPALLTALPADGVYTINVLHLSGAAGNFTIALEAVDATPLVIGRSLDTEMVSPAGAAFRFEGHSGDVVDIGVTAYDSYALDLYIFLVAPDGTILASDDDSGPDLNPSLLVVLEQTGTYKLLVYIYAGPPGQFSVDLTAPELITLTLDETVSATAEGGVTSFRFAGTAGQQITISASSDVIDTTLEVLGPEGRLAFDDDSGEGTNSRITALTLPTDGTYIIIMREFYGEEGPFSITVTEGDGEGDGPSA